MKSKFSISTGMKLVRRASKLGKPDTVTVIDKDPENNWLIQIEKPNGDKTFMHKATIPIFYKPINEGEQSELFAKPKTWVHKLREKLLK